MQIFAKATTIYHRVARSGMEGIEGQGHGGNTVVRSGNGRVDLRCRRSAVRHYLLLISRPEKKRPRLLIADVIGTIRRRTTRGIVSAIGAHVLPVVKFLATSSIKSNLSKHEFRWSTSTHFGSKRLNGIQRNRFLIVLSYIYLQNCLCSIRVETRNHITCELESMDSFPRLKRIIEQRVHWYYSLQGIILFSSVSSYR